ncbi:hypothetical protein ACIBUR_28950 [Streptomyces anulatus]
MRRIVMSVGALAAAAVMGIAGTTPAYAAQGTLFVNGERHENPSGCIKAEGWPLRLTNRTDATVTVFSTPDCSDSPTDSVEPGGRGVFEFGQSVSVE